MPFDSTFIYLGVGGLVDRTACARGHSPRRHGFSVAGLCEAGRRPMEFSICERRGPWRQPLGVRAACRRFRLDERATEIEGGFVSPTP